MDKSGANLAALEALDVDQHTDQGPADQPRAPIPSESAPMFASNA
jgi:hypothetical protein